MAEEAKEIQVDDTDGFETYLTDGELPAEDAAPLEEGEETGEESAPAKTEEEPEPADDAGAEPVKKNRFQKRIDRLTKRAAEAERRAEAAEKKLTAQGKPPESEAVAGTEEPEPDDFEDYNDYLDALTDYKAELKFAEKMKKAKPEEPKGDTEAADEPEVERDIELEDATDYLFDAFADYRAKHDDFDDVVQAADLKITRDMVVAMADTDDPAGIAYHLGKNKDEAARIAKLTPLAQAREIGKLEVLLTQPKPEIKPTPKKQTKAPEPIDPLKGGDASTKAPHEMDFAEYEQAMNEREYGRKGFW